MSNYNTELGLSCPKEGKFYVCDAAKVQFIGCCTVDPCANKSGYCPRSNLRNTTFSSDQYLKIPKQDCDNADGDKNWYTCQEASPPFLGCCQSNPCQQGYCPTEDLIPARLSNITTNAQALLGTATSTSATLSATEAPTLTSTPSPSPDSGAHLSTGAIIGIAVGGAAVVFILIGILAYKCGWWARHKKAEQEAKQGPHSAMASPFGYSPVSPGFPQSYQDPRQSAISSTNPGSPPGYHPYSPGVPSEEAYASSQPGNHHSLAPSDTWNHDPRHASHMSSATWDSLSTAIAHKQHPMSMELDGHEVARSRMVSELPSSSK